jgi:hypothetical protein
MKSFSKVLPGIMMVFVHVASYAQVQDILPPVLQWKGKSESLIVKKDHAWITPTEKNDFKTTPNYKETISWIEKVSASTGLFKLVSIGKSAQNRDIWMVIASADGDFNSEALRLSPKPLLLMQAGIHAGEIDGKDAGLMLLRDIAFGKKADLLRDVNILFIPILNVDGHERSSIYNRVNQRGPENMGWRTNARNLNLNRDYTKLDSEEIKAVVNVMNEYQPSLYLDLHVTDGADYQYDITYGFSASYSTEIGKWLSTFLKSTADQHLKTNGHIPGPLMFATNDRDFTAGNVEFAFEPRFSNTYGDLRRLPSVLVENHSLKPFKQRVLGTYIFLEAVIQALAKDGASLKKAIEKDRSLRNPEIVLTWTQNPKSDSMLLLGIESKIQKSTITGKDYVVWTGKQITTTIPYVKNDLPASKAKRPKAYLIPAAYKSVIDKLILHGISLEILETEITADVKMYRIADHKFASQPFEGHFGVTGKVSPENRKEVFYPGAVRATTDQPLGDLLIHLMEPEATDSFFQWGYFVEIFNRTEYIEEYAIEPLARKMLLDENLKADFEKKKQSEPDFINNSQAVYEWFYSRSPFVDQRYLLYPIGIEQ